MEKSTTVMHVLTEEKMTYYNSHFLRDNLISAIILLTERALTFLPCCKG